MRPGQGHDSRFRSLWRRGRPSRYVVLVVVAAAVALQLGTDGTATQLVLVGAIAFTVTELGAVGLRPIARQESPTAVEHYPDLSLDLLCTMSFDGAFFEWVNPAWERTLGYSRAELLRRPRMEFVHPEDRERTGAEIAKLATIGTDTVSFRNRYRAADGSYRWLEWNTRAVPSERRLYAAARDVTVAQRAEEALERQAEILESMLSERTRALDEARLEMLQRLALAAEYHDHDTHQHTERVGRSAALIARQLGLPEQSVALIRRAAPLHDIGKIGISNAILLKEGKLTPEELEQMQEHTRIGAEILAHSQFAILQMAQLIALTHHERWDGTGYPDGLSGRAIPLSGRIVAVADTFDALTHRRPYKEAWPIERAVAEIERLVGRHFDQRVVNAFEAFDHQRLLEPVEHYDLDLPPPPPTVGPSISSLL